MNKKGKKEAPAKELVATLPQRTPRSRRSQKSQPSQQNPQKSQMPKEEQEKKEKSLKEKERNTNMRLIYEHIKPTKEEPQEM